MFQSFDIAYLRKNVKVREARPLNFLRESTAYLLSNQARRVPHAAGIVPLDVTALIEYGADKDSALNKSSEKLGPEKLLRRAIHRNHSAFFLKALAHTLHHNPELNGFIDYTPLRNGGTFYLAEDVNLSFTVHSKYGVVRPIVRNPHLKTIETVAQEMRMLARKARRTDINELYSECTKIYIKTALKQLDITGWKAALTWLRSRIMSRGANPSEFADTPEHMRLTPHDVLGSTCTLANIGMSVAGFQTLTVIIPPEVTMFGLGNVELVPRVIDGEIVPRYMVNTCISLDHRAIDGGDIFPYGASLKRYADDPALIYEWKEGDEVS
jgi:pyruvate/2-oxoglutarate dehydrogenase complex dihydrolipoamide acyltransferase (E2) component